MREKEVGSDIEIPRGWRRKILFVLDEEPITVAEIVIASFVVMCFGMALVLLVTT